MRRSEGLAQGDIQIWCNQAGNIDFPTIISDDKLYCKILKTSAPLDLSHLRKGMKYRVDIGGLRALAIISVVLFHFKVTGFSGGFSGVDVFFVISGYLMSCIFMTKVDSGIYGVFSFYKSRFLRIYPALISMVLISYLTLCIVGAKGWMLDFYHETKYALSFISNIFYSSHSGYFDVSADTRWLLHTWSLSVEWQFYIIFPIIVLLVSNVTNKKNIKHIYIALFLASIFACFTIMRNGENNTFYSLFSRAWELFAGAIISTIRFRANHLIKRITEVSGILLIIASSLFLSSKNWPGLYTIIPVLGCSLVILSSMENSKSLLRWWPLQRLGDISYSFYLWHWIICAFMNNSDIDFSPINVTISIFISVIAATISHRFFEKWKIGGFWLLITVSIITFGLIFSINNRVEDTSKKIAFFSNYSPEDLDKQFTNKCFLTSKTKSFDEFNKKDCLSLSTTKPNILLFGDSHAAQLSSSLRATLDGYNVLQATASGCLPYNGAKGWYPFCTILSSYIYDDFLKNNKIDVVILSAYWASDIFHDFDLVKPSIKKIKSSGAKVIVIGQTAAFKKPFPMIAMQTPTSELNLYIDNNALDFYKNREAEISSLSDLYIDAYTLNGASYFTDDGYPLYLDSNHVTPYGADIISRKIRDKISKLF